MNDGSTDDKAQDMHQNPHPSVFEMFKISITFLPEMFSWQLSHSGFISSPRDFQKWNSSLKRLLSEGPSIANGACY